MNQVDRERRAQLDRATARATAAEAALRLARAALSEIASSRKMTVGQLQKLALRVYNETKP